MRAKPKGTRYRTLFARAGVVLSLGLVGCAHRPQGPPRQPWDEWARPGGTEEQRAADYADCKSQGKAWGVGGVGIIVAHNQNEDIYRACMVSRGWRMSGEPGSADREVPPNYGH